MSITFGRFQQIFLTFGRKAGRAAVIFGELGVAHEAVAKEGIGGLPYDLGVRFGEGDFFPVGFRPKAAGTYETFDRGGVFHEDDPHAGMDAVTAGTAAHLPLPHPYVVGEIVGGAALL